MEAISDAAHFLSARVHLLNKRQVDVEEKHSKPLLHIWEIRHHPCLVYLMKGGGKIVICNQCAAIIVYKQAKTK